MKTHKFVCPECKHEWSEEFGYESEVMCPACETIWRLTFDAYDLWPPTNYRIERKSDEQPKFDLTIGGTKIPGCMKVKIEQETYKAHSLVTYRMVAEFFNELTYGTILLVTGDHSDVTICLHGHPEIRPISMHVSAHEGPGNTIVFTMDGTGYEFARAQMKAMWEKSNR